MTEDRTMNPTIFRVEGADDARLSDRGRAAIGDALKALPGRTLYASHYRPDEFWDEPVFVCPACGHSDPDPGPRKKTHECGGCHFNWHLGPWAKPTPIKETQP